MNRQLDPEKFDADGLQYTWSANSLEVAQTCLKKYQLTQIEGWVAKRKSANLLFGGWYAEALERFHVLLSQGTDRDAALRAVIRHTLLATWIDGQPWESDHNTKTRANLLRTIIWYVDQFNPDPLEVVHLADGTPAVELKFRLELDEAVDYTGKIDRLVRYNDDVYVQDQKTTGGTVGSYYFDNYNPDIQMTGYIFAARAAWTGPVKGVIIDAAQIAIGFSRFERGYTFRTPAQLEEWYNDSLYFIREARDATRKGEFPRNRSSCGKYGGCMFREVCSRSPEVREQFLKGDFEQRPGWLPAEGR